MTERQAIERYGQAAVDAIRAERERREAERAMREFAAGLPEPRPWWRRILGI